MAYVRMNSSVEVVENKKNTQISIDIQADESKKNKVSKIRETSLDIQAILTVIGRRKYSFNAGEFNPLNMQKTYLREVDLTNANLEKAKFMRSHLEEARLMGASFKSANLSETNLKGALLVMTILKEANLMLANLEGANLTLANFKGAKLLRANLEGADLRAANFKGTSLGRADLKGAKLYNAIDLSLDQLSKVKTLYNAELDEDLRKELEEKYPDKYQALIKKPN